ncbi:DUF2939 domain-containing protein [Janthinobacterium sp. SUN026]|uniref:DUF2939 domain-containing protein n=1 Tax=unclassified Janthinobacterium TaxID=2610881 RepID=UPI0025B35DC8|nr:MULTISPECIES: DUF2939 domain-containing protein [unclassified Janthinobacterium]MDN2671710.1 DUF2939 domain-containing protein [Janthinobacterium sp. SUN026]MDN2700986.1 DUF2939 domain-containing protein [Janthinobacterium sp. SUN100]
MKKTTIAAAAAVIAVAVTAYASPYYTLHQIKTALAERNADALAAHVDFPALRASVKTQLEASMARSIEATAGSGNPLAALGQSIASAMLGKMVDTMVSPAGVVALVNKSAVSPQAEPNPDAPADGARKKADYSAGYAGLNTFIVRAKDGNAQEGALILLRHGVWGWKLSSIEIASAMAAR